MGSGISGTWTPFPGNTTGTYAMRVAEYPLNGSTTYDPTTVSGADLTQACRTSNLVTLAPSYSFAGYCMEDIVFPDAFDQTQSVTIKCPTQTATSSSGMPVKVPGLVCIQGNDSDAT
jgi:hypothetical protein